MRGVVWFVAVASSGAFACSALTDLDSLRSDAGVSDASDASPDVVIADGGVSVVQFNEKNTFTASYLVAQTAGNENIVVLEAFPNDAGVVATVTDSAQNTYGKRFGPSYGAAGNSHFEVWSSDSIKAAGAGNSVVATYTNPSAMIATSIWILEVHSAAGAMSFDTSITTLTSSALTASTGTTPPLRDKNEVVIAFTNPSGKAAVPPGAPWTNVGVANTGSDVAFQSVSSGGAYGATFTSSNGLSDWIAGIVTFGDGLGP